MQIHASRLVVLTLGLFSVTGHAQIKLLEVTGGASPLFFGHSVDGAGDIDGDGLADILVGSIRDGTQGSNAGAAHVYSGATGQLIQSWYGATSDDVFGFDVAGAGDVDADGFLDVVIGANQQWNGLTGYARIYSGASGFLLFGGLGYAPMSRYGEAVAGGADVNQDGFDDVALGAPEENGKTGRVEILRGPSGGSFATFFGPGGSSSFGSAVAFIGDLTADGRPDLLVGAEFSGPGSSGTVDAIDVYSGALIHQWVGDDLFDQFGCSVDSAGDLDGDSIDDVIVGAWADDDGGSASGSVRAFSGASGAMLYTFHANDPGDQLGISVAGVGDVDGDGVNEVLAGSNFGDGLITDAGAAALLSGPTGALNAIYSGDAAGESFGWSVASAGDVNGDGLPDVVVSSHLDFHDGPFSGSFSVFTGTCGTITAHGQGCGGTFGFVPELELSGCPVAGGSITLSISKAFGGSTSLTFLGGAPTQLPIGDGCDLLISPIFPGVVTLPLSGAGPGQGNVTITGPLPAGVSGYALSLQSFCLDALVPRGYAASNGATFTVP